MCLCVCVGGGGGGIVAGNYGVRPSAQVLRIRTEIRGRTKGWRQPHFALTGLGLGVDQRSGGHLSGLPRRSELEGVTKSGDGRGCASKEMSRVSVGLGALPPGQSPGGSDKDVPGAWSAPWAGVWLEMGQCLRWGKRDPASSLAAFPVPERCPPPRAEGSTAPRANEWRLANLEPERAQDQAAESWRRRGRLRPKFTLSAHRPPGS